jgi:multidrug efflux pump subunit AcrA (membrane-fusion protein)
MKSYITRIIGLILTLSLFMLSACSDVEKPLLYKVDEQNFAIIIPAKGELYSAQATIINTPATGGMGKTIAWLAPEYSMVKKGQVIVKFDGESLRVASAEKNNELSINQQDFNEKNGGLAQQQNAINEDIDLTVKEKRFAEQFSINDIRIRSKLKILESMQNSEYLQTKADYLAWSNSKFANRAEGERSLILIKQRQLQSKLDQLSSNLAQLEIKAPHDGLLVYAMNWRKEKPRSGQMMWPGQKIAQLPDVSKMQLKLQVAESEALGLAKKQLVKFHLNAQAGRTFTGTIISVAPFPQTIKRGDPVKYFEVIVKLDDQQKFFLPSKKVNAEIIVEKDRKALIVPRQSVFTKNNKTFVYVYQQDKFKKVDVVLGKSSLSHVEIIFGLNLGQEISFYNEESS